MNDQFLISLSKIEKAKPSRKLYERIEANLFDNKIIAFPTLALVAASILLLFFVNIYAVKNTSALDSRTSTSVYSNQIINDFEIY